MFSVFSVSRTHSLNTTTTETEHIENDGGFHWARTGKKRRTDKGLNRTKRVEKERRRIQNRPINFSWGRFGKL